MSFMSNLIYYAFAGSLALIAINPIADKKKEQTIVYSDFKNSISNEGSYNTSIFSEKEKLIYEDYLFLSDPVKYDAEEFRYLRCGRGTPYREVLNNAKRFKNLIRTQERKYNMPRGLLAGLMIQESCGNPLQLSSFGDGGAGLFQFQPGTARAYNLKVHGNSFATGRDVNHHQELKILIRNTNNDINKLIKFDERFDPEKATKAAASYLNDLRRTYGSWTRAVSAYNAGRPVQNYRSSSHVRGVEKFQRMYNNHLNNRSR